MVLLTSSVHDVQIFILRVESSPPVHHTSSVWDVGSGFLFTSPSSRLSPNSNPCSSNFPVFLHVSLHSGPLRQWPFFSSDLYIWFDIPSVQNSELLLTLVSHVSLFSSVGTSLGTHCESVPLFSFSSVFYTGFPSVFSRNNTKTSAPSPSHVLPVYHLL